MQTPVGSEIVRGLGFITLSSLAFSVMGVCMKKLAVLGVAEVVFFRGLLSLVLTLATLRAVGALTRERVLGSSPTGRRLLLLRAGAGVTALVLYVAALHRIPYADAAALLYTSPLFTAVFAYLFLGEAMPRRSWFALGLGLVGSGLVLRPQLAADAVGGLCGFGAGLVSGVAYTSVRAASKHEHGQTIVLWFAALSLPLATSVMVFDFVWPSPTGWAWIGGLGVSAQLGQVFLTRALASAPAGTVMIGAFSTLAASAAWGWALFGEALNAWTAAGAGCILAGILLVALRRGPRRDAAAPRDGGAVS